MATEERSDAAIPNGTLCHCEERSDAATPIGTLCHCEERSDAAIQSDKLMNFRHHAIASLPATTNCTPFPPAKSVAITSADVPATRPLLTPTQRIQEFHP